MHHSFCFKQITDAEMQNKHYCEFDIQKHKYPSRIVNFYMFQSAACVNKDRLYKNMNLLWFTLHYLEEDFTHEIVASVDPSVINNQIPLP